MIASPGIAIDLPPKGLVWNDTDGDVRVTYNKPEYIQQRHSPPEQLSGDLSGITADSGSARFIIRMPQSKVSKVSFSGTAIGKKTVVAVTGIILYIYVLGHLAGNLLIYRGRSTINGYARLLHANAGLLWTARAILLVAVVLHIVISTQLWWLDKHVARPIGYVKKKNVPPAYASARMMWTGPAIALFVIFHVLHLTTGSTGLPYHEFDAYGNLVGGFRIGWVAAIYIVAMLALSMHLYHGFWSFFQSLGVSQPRHNRNLKYAAHVLAIFIAAGFISIPVMILAGVVR